MARLSKRLEDVEKEVRKRGLVVIPSEHCVIALVSPVTKKPVEYFDLAAWKFIPTELYERKE